jgi:uncharacterized protein YgiM (DUF1202 family)
MPSAIAQSAGTPGTVGVDFLNVRMEPSATGVILATLPAGTALTVLAGPVTAGGFNWYQVQAGDQFGWAVSSFVLTGGTASGPGAGTGAQWVYGDTVTVNTDALNVRALPAQSAQILDVYRSGRVATVTGDAQVVDGITWYPLDRLGWVAGQFLSGGVQGADGTGSTPGAVPALTGSWVYGDTVTVTTGVLNVRELPSLSAPVVARYALSQVATVTGDATMADGITWFPLDNLGWVSGQFLATSGATAPAPTAPGTTPPAPAAPGGVAKPTALAYGDAVVVSSSLLNVRAEPGVSQDIVAVYPAGKQAVISGHSSVADGYTWVAVDRLGWVVADFLAYVGPGTVPAAAPAAVTASGADTTAVSVSTTPDATVSPPVAQPSTTATSPSLRPTTAARTPSPTPDDEAEEVEVDETPEPVATERPDAPAATERPSAPATERPSAPAATEQPDAPAATEQPDAPAATEQPTTQVEPVYVTPTVAAAEPEATEAADEAEEPAAAETFSDGQNVVVDTGRLNIRSGPSYDASVVRIVDNGAEFTVYGEPVQAEGYTWYRVSSTQEEWVDGQFLAAK